MENYQYIDLEAGLMRVRGNKTLYLKMLHMFLNSEDVKGFDVCLPERNTDKCANAIHGIKGITGNLGFTDLFDKSVVLLDEFRGGIYDEAHIADYHESLEGTTSEVKKLIAELEAEA